MQRAKCPTCQALLPFFIFSPSCRIRRTSDCVVFRCPSCKLPQSAHVTDAYKRNRIVVFISTFLGVPISCIVASFFPKPFTVIVIMVVIFIFAAVPTIYGHHKMIFKKGEAISK